MAPCERYRQRRVGGRTSGDIGLGPETRAGSGAPRGGSRALPPAPLHVSGQKVMSRGWRPPRGPGGSGREGGESGFGGGGGGGDRARGGRGEEKGGGARLVGAPPGDGRRKTSRRPFNSQRRCAEFRPGSGGVRSPGFTSELAASGTPRNRCYFFSHRLLRLLLRLPFRRTGRERGVWRNSSHRGGGGWRGAATGGGPPGAEP